MLLFLFQRKNLRRAENDKKCEKKMKNNSSLYFSVFLRKYYCTHASDFLQFLGGALFVFGPINSAGGQEKGFYISIKR
jgi:hypothetical protein